VKLWLVLLIVLALHGIAWGSPSALDGVTTDLDQQFAGRDGCFIIYDMASAHTVLRYNDRRCGQRLAPYSTFKIPLAVMAFDKGLLHDANTAFHWDGTDHGRDTWNRDQTAASWLRESVVWVSQILTQRLGAATVRHYLAAFQYGNHDISGGLTRFWLGSTLKISSDEQIAFLRRLWQKRLAAAAGPSQVRACALLPTLARADGGSILGKTGSGTVNGGRTLGWFVGYVVTPKSNVYVFVVNFEDHARGRTDGPGGFAARDIALRVLPRLP